MKWELIEAIDSICKELFDQKVLVELSRPDEHFGDYSTNVAMKLAAASKGSENPRSIAEKLAEKLRSRLADLVDRVEVAGAGFLNFRLSDKTMIESIVQREIEKPLAGQTIVAEYSDPNPFKVLHGGHLYTSIVGDSIANILQESGGDVHRVNFGGDVGLHVAKSMWAIVNHLGSESPEKLDKISKNDRADWLTDRYIEGSAAYEKYEHAKNAIIDINKRVYSVVNTRDKKSSFAQIYWTTRQWSYDYFDEFYERIGVSFEKFYAESEVAGMGIKKVNQHLGEVYEESDGAIIFRGEKHGLHTRVFITKEGIPTYEAKDIGLIFHKARDYKFDKSIVITGNEQMQYMQVVLKSLEQFDPKLANATRHLTHGMVKLSGGQKMSSRQGNILRAVDILELAATANQAQRGKNDALVSIGAVKYSFLKNKIGGDIVYNPEESVSLEGNSGPYIQYALVRARSIMKKAGKKPGLLGGHNLDIHERSLARKISTYPEVFSESAADLSPHLICVYLYELCQIFNRFYENSRVIDDPRSELRLFLLDKYTKTLEHGLGILGIEAPEAM